MARCVPKVHVSAEDLPDWPLMRPGTSLLLHAGRRPDHPDHVRYSHRSGRGWGDFVFGLAMVYIFRSVNNKPRQKKLFFPTQ
jgi:hypothetical protein